MKTVLKTALALLLVLVLELAVAAAPRRPSRLPLRRSTGAIPCPTAGTESGRPSS